MTIEQTMALTRQAFDPPAFSDASLRHGACLQNHRFNIASASHPRGWLVMPLATRFRLMFGKSLAQRKVGETDISNLVRANLAESVNNAHAARSGRSAFGNRTSLSAASCSRAGTRQCGMEFDRFQPDTVDTGTSSAVATLTVPPSFPMKALTVCMPIVLRKS